MRLILTKPTLISSAKLLKNALNDVSKEKFEISTEGIKNTNSVTKLIRWGNSFGPMYTAYNRADVIGISGNKLAFSRFLSTRDIPCITFHSEEPTKFPIAIRTIMNGSGGEGLIIATNKEMWNKYRGCYWSKWFQFTFELGVHILGGQTVKIFKKVPESGIEEDFPVRNLERGYHFVKVNPLKYKKLAPLIENFYREFPINMSRLDVGWDSENHMYRIIECNSAPALSNNHDTLGLYTDYLMNVLQLKGEK